MNNGSVAPVIISGINCGMVPDGVALNVGKVFGFAHKLRARIDPKYEGERLG